MITIAKLGVGTAQDYYRADYTAAGNRYYTQGQSLQGYWQGRLAEEMGLRGAVTDEQFERLTNGQHPWTAEQLIAWRGGEPKPAMLPPPMPEWVDNNAAWKEKIEAVYVNALEAGINPLEPGKLPEDWVAVGDAVKWLLKSLEQTAPAMRQELVRQLTASFGGGGSRSKAGGPRAA